MDFYHLLNRGVDKRDVVCDDSDRLRFVQNLFVMNDMHYAPHNLWSRSRRVLQTECEPLVRIHAWCLMSNHYHLLVSPLDDNDKNISRFVQKLNMGYSKYFNEKYQRVGALWQGKTKKLHIERDGHFLHIPYYIHLNPLDINMPEWRSGKVRSVRTALENLNTYRWSSFLDYWGKKNFPSVIDNSELSEILGSANHQRSVIADIIKIDSGASTGDFLE